jgi:hypothetical protein
MSFRSRALILIVTLSLVDAIIPVPILGLGLVYAIVCRPTWARSLAREILDA